MECLSRVQRCKGTVDTLGKRVGAEQEHLVQRVAEPHLRVGCRPSRASPSQALDDAPPRVSAPGSVSASKYQAPGVLGTLVVTIALRESSTAPLASVTVSVTV